jgi:hypothetical protein
MSDYLDTLLEEIRMERERMERERLMRQSFKLVQIRKLWSRLDKDERLALQGWFMEQCACCGRPGLFDGRPWSNGAFCDACFDEQKR